MKITKGFLAPEEYSGQCETARMSGQNDELGTAAVRMTFPKRAGMFRARPIRYRAFLELDTAE